jgi:phosphoribosyl-ATP pyrophosphohydrolase
MNIKELFSIIEDRKNNPSEKSYVSGLFKEGLDRIAQKVGEEGVEVVIASKNTENQRFIEEMADLWFHSLVLLAEKNLTPEDIFQELAQRHERKEESSLKE